MKRTWLLALQFLFAQATIAQQNLPPVFTIKTDSASFYHIQSPYLQLLADPEKRFTIELVIKSPASDLFRFSSEKQQVESIRYDTYWARFRIRNTLPYAVTIYFPTEHDRLDQYVIDGSSVLLQKTGYSVGWQKRDGHKFLRAVSVHLAAGEEKLVYHRWHDVFPFLKRNVHEVTFRMGDDITNETSINSLISHPWQTFVVPFILGVLLVGFFYHLLNYFLLKDKAFLYFSLWLLFYFVYQVFIEYELNNTLLRNLIPVYLGAPAAMYFWNVLWRIGMSMFLLYQTLFVCNLLKIKQASPTNYQVLIGLVIFQIFTNFGSYSLAFYFPDLSQAVLRLIVFSIANITNAYLGIMIILQRKKSAIASFLALTIAPFLLLWTALQFGWNITGNFNLFRVEITLVFVQSFVNLWLFFTAFSYTWLVVLFSVALTRRYTKAVQDLSSKQLEIERIEKEKQNEKYQIIEAQKNELEHKVEERTAELKRSLEELKATQAQLVQKEKMASLGELTAGIAHEIQNPLNFINNFSETNKELVEEMEQEIERGNLQEIKVIACNIKENEKKVLHHGKRADAIVKNMLEHSRTSKGEKQPTDINALVEEYLRLSYHGIKAKDKSFTAILETHLDPLIGKADIVPQDVGRVLLNLFNNAFYAVRERRKISGDGYEPVVQVATRRADEMIEIRVRDNGTGIPEKVLEKIYQPFFTTKPTGEGTGLGLSLSYDIIKAHGGEMRVDTKEGEGTEFTIQLIQNK